MPYSTMRILQAQESSLSSRRFLSKWLRHSQYAMDFRQHAVALEINERGLFGTDGIDP